jgi:pantetheine-phosphate adenylyltransferase
VVAIARSESKHPLFSLEERRLLVEEAVQAWSNVSVDVFDGLLVTYVEQRSGQAVIRGLRAVSDFEFEFQLALMNRKLNERVETIFMMPKETFTFLSSRIIKEIAGLGGDIGPFVPPQIQKALLRKLGRENG